MKLSDMISDPSVKASIVEDCTKLIDEQVANKSGISGMTLKTAYRVVKGVGPGYIKGAIGRILPEACSALDPIWCEGIAMGNPVEYLTQNCSRAADILLSITDTRAQKTSGAVASAYKKLRKSVKGDVEEAIPGFAVILGDHAQAASSV